MECQSTTSSIAIKPMDENQPAHTDSPSTRQEEWRSFLFFTVVMAPALAFMIVGGYGFLVWMYQLFAGPPGS